MLIDFLSLLHVQMICCIIAINVNKMLVKDRGGKGDLLLFCAIKLPFHS